MDEMYRKLKILADSAKFDVSCSSSGSGRRNSGRMGNAVMPGCCHSWSSDGRCISLLKVLYTNKCIYDCEYCINRRSADTERASFEPEELAKLTMEFYRRNYIEGLFLSSAVEISPDHTSERMLHALRILRYDHGFSGYIHAKVIPGTSPEIIHSLGLEADRLSVNAELPARESLSILAPQKTPQGIFSPMKQITNTLIERRALKGPGTMFRGEDINTERSYLPEGEKHDAFAGGSVPDDFTAGMIRERSLMPPLQAESVVPAAGKKFAPAGQTTQMIIGADQSSDRQIIKVSERIYRTFKVKRVYYSAYIPVVRSPLLPDLSVAPPLAREHRLYQADWLLRFYGFSADELFDDSHPDLDPDLDPKVSWALRNLDLFPVEVNQADMGTLLRVPGIGTISALRIIRQRRVSAVCADDLKKMGVVLKRARHFITCSGIYSGEKHFMPEMIKEHMLDADGGMQLSFFGQKTRMIDG